MFSWAWMETDVSTSYHHYLLFCSSDFFILFYSSYSYSPQSGQIYNKVVIVNNWSCPGCLTKPVKISGHSNMLFPFSLGSKMWLAHPVNDDDSWIIPACAQLKLDPSWARCPVHAPQFPLQALTEKSTCMNGEQRKKVVTKHKQKMKLNEVYKAVKQWRLLLLGMFPACPLANFFV